MTDPICRRRSPCGRSPTPKRSSTCGRDRQSRIAVEPCGAMVARQVRQLMACTSPLPSRSGPPSASSGSSRSSTPTPATCARSPRRCSTPSGPPTAASTRRSRRSCCSTRSRSSRASAARSPEAAADLRARDRRVRGHDPLRVELMCAGTHPFARWAQPEGHRQGSATPPSSTAPSGGAGRCSSTASTCTSASRTATRCCRSARRCSRTSAHLQSLSASSPFWGGKDTGYASNRALMFQQLPTAGLPFQFQRLVASSRHTSPTCCNTGVIDVFDEIRWDLRPVAESSGRWRSGSATASRTSCEVAQHLRADALPRRALLHAARRRRAPCRPCRRGSRRRTSGARRATAWTRSSSSTSRPTRSWSPPPSSAAGRARAGRRPAGLRRRARTASAGSS